MADEGRIDVRRMVPFFGLVELKNIKPEDHDAELEKALKAKAARAAQLQARGVGIREQSRRNILVLNAENARRSGLAKALPPKTP
jgi:hypothetical protein